MFTFLTLLSVTILGFTSCYFTSRYRTQQCEYLTRDSEGSYPDVYVPFWTFFPVMAAAAILGIWYFQNPSAMTSQLDAFFPSFKTSNWIWVCVAFIFCGIPTGSVIFILGQLTKIRPEGTSLYFWIVGLLCLVGLAAYVIPLGNIYSWWVIWIPILSAAAYPLGVQSYTSVEKKENAENYDRHVEESARQDAERERRYQQWKEDRRNRQRNSGSSSPSLSSTASLKVVIDGYTFHMKRSSTVTPDIYYDQNLTKWQRLPGNRWRRLG